jgi:Cysteine-rich secretory protein family
MRVVKRILIVCAGLIVCACAGWAQSGAGEVVPGAAEQLLAFANAARAQAGVGKLAWDESLASAALDHCSRMAAEGPISHRYGGEASLSERGGQAGARFDLIEENVALGPTPHLIHEGWMQSPGHRENLLNENVNRVGIAVVAARGELYAVADYSRAVISLSQTDVEARVARLIRVSGVKIVNSPATARAACPANSGVPPANGGPQAMFVERWQDSMLNQLPPTLTAKLASGQYQMAAVGSCPAQGMDGQFSSYRVAVLLY